MTGQAQSPTRGAGLDLNIHKTLSLPARKSIINDYWKAGLSDRDFTKQYNNFNAYFENYESLCQSCSPADLGQLRHSDLLEAFNRIISQSRETCAGELKALLHNFPAPFSQPRDADEFVQMWIDTTAECLLLVDVSSWSGALTLKEFLAAEFAAQKTSVDRMQLPRKFHARNLTKIAAMRIRWTSLLSKHLALEESEGGDNQVAIFHQAYVMDIFSRSGLFPDGLFDETRRTLNIFVPLFTPSSTKWFKQEMSTGFFSSGRLRYRPDPTVALSGSMSQEQRKLENFTYFRDRLIILKEEYDAHEPQNVIQYWYDYRKPAQWWAFWIAVLVFIFGVTQIIEGAIQCYKAYYPST